MVNSHLLDSGSEKQPMKSKHIVEIIISEWAVISQLL